MILKLVNILILLWLRLVIIVVSEKIDPFKGELYRYLNFNEIDGFEDEGRVIPLEQMPKIEDILGIPV